MDLSATVWPLQTTSGFTKKGKKRLRASFNERQTIRDAVSGARDCKYGVKQRPTSAYAQTGSKNMAKTT